MMGLLMRMRFSRNSGRRGMYHPLSRDYKNTD